MIVLGIESSCDETAAAVVENGKTILSSIVASQIDLHRPYGGVVPELASRKHIEAIVPVVNQALESANISKKNLDGVAATQGPGLAGALLVGFGFAKAYAYALGIPMVGVDHLEGHLFSVFLNDRKPPFPFVSLLVSGGHTALYLVNSFSDYQRLGQTRDDAAGEAFDKVAKMMGLGYPGGQVIESLASTGDPFKIQFPKPYVDKENFDFSFSGIKTAVLRYLQTHSDTYKAQMPDIAAAFQESVVEVLSYKIIHAARSHSCRQLSVVGGAAANRRLRDKIRAAADKNNFTVHIPPLSLCGDNAAMIAAVGYHRLARGEHTDMQADVYSRTR
jgi:N6-L-threonylcarbamoyladenine synthase